MVYDLRHADVRVKWLVTCLLATFGIAYAFGAWMVALYAGFTPTSVARTYAEPAMTMPMPPAHTVVTEHPVHLGDLADEGQHTVDRDLLIQDTHVHVPMYGVIAGTLSMVVLGLAVSRRLALGLITLLFAAPWLDFAGMWLTKLVSPGFSIVTLAGGWAMGLAYTIVAGVALWQMWGPSKGASA
jgi:hypothetical protein